jgi:hypothetical protein
MTQRAGKRSTRTAELQRKCLDMRVAGASYEQISDGLGIGVASAWRHVNTGLALSRKVSAETADKVRAMELRRIDAIVVSLWPRRSDPRTADTILRAMDRRATLEGLDAPQKVEVTDGLDDSQRAARIAAILDAARARRTG